MKKKLVSMLLLSCVLLNTTIVNAAQTISVTGDTASGSTASSFNVTAGMLDGGNLVVTVPDQLTLVHSQTNSNFAANANVNVKGNINPAKVVNISTPVNINFSHSEDTSISAGGTISFGEGGVNQYTAQDLQAAGSTGVNKELNCTVPKSEVEYVGTYKSSIVFDIELADKTSTTYYMGYSYVESSELDPITDDNTIDYDTYAQTDTVAVLREFSTNKADINSKNYDKVISSNSVTLSIPEQLDTYDVAQIDFSTFFSNSKISNLVTRVEVPATVTGIELAENTESTSTAVIVCANDRASVSLAEKLPSNVQLQFKEQSSGGGGSIPDESEATASSCFDVKATLIHHSDSNYMYRIIATHNSDHTTDNEILTLTFNEPVTYLSSEGALLSGNGTTTLQLGLSRFLNPTGSCGFDLRVLCESDSLGLVSARIQCGGAGDI